MRIDRGMDHLGITTVILLNALLDKPGIGDEMIDTVRGPAIPFPQPIANRRHRKAANRIEGVIPFRVPDVTHRCVTVADMHCRTGADALRNSVAR